MAAAATPDALLDDLCAWSAMGTPRDIPAVTLPQAKLAEYCELCPHITSQEAKPQSSAAAASAPALPAPAVPQPWRHALDVRGEKQARAASAESAFATIAVSRGFAARKTRTSIDAQLHIDFVLVDGSDPTRRVADELQAVFVDVKALKSLASGASTQAAELWVELQGAHKGHAGWLLGGRAHVIAVQLRADEGREAFALLDRAALAKFCLDKAEHAESCTSARDALYRLYNRRDNEILMRVLLCDAYAVAGCGVWTR